MLTDHGKASTEHTVADFSTAVPLKSRETAYRAAQRRFTTCVLQMTKRHLRVMPPAVGIHPVDEHGLVVRQREDALTKISFEALRAAVLATSVPRTMPRPKLLGTLCTRYGYQATHECGCT